MNSRTAGPPELTHGVSYAFNSTPTTQRCLFVLTCGFCFFELPVKANLQDLPENKAKGSPSPSPRPSSSKVGTELDGPPIVHSDLISLTVTVTDSFGRRVAGLNKNAFTVLDEKQPQEITFFSEDDTPIAVGILFDTSLSVRGVKIKDARDALTKCVQTSHKDDDYFLVGFKVKLLMEINRVPLYFCRFNRLANVRSVLSTYLLR
ncbi:MAG: hypothetical protein ND866_30430 [Pyrinomonadaceae bacterium]|nr:hypothetical protein [Pyrinomonadaceae bacterium]